jgi:hypothetical protein
MHPSTVMGRASCDDLGTDMSVEVTEVPLPGNVVRPAKNRWVRFLAAPNAPAGRTVDLSQGELRTTLQRNDFFYAHARLTDTDVEGWVSGSEIRTPRGGYGLIGHGVATPGVLSGNCGGSSPRRLKTITDLRIGATGQASVIVGEISAGTTVITRATEGDLVGVMVPPCELVPAIDGETFWIATSALD